MGEEKGKNESGKEETLKTEPGSVLDVKYMGNRRCLMKKQTKIISIVSIILVFIIGVGGYFMYQKELKEKAIRKASIKLRRLKILFRKQKRMKKS